MSKSSIFKLFAFVLFAFLTVSIQAQGDSDTSRFAKGEIIIKFKPSFDSPLVASFLENQNLNLLSSITADRWALIGFDRNSDVLSKLQALKNLPIIEWVQPNYIYQLCAIPNDLHFDSLWSLHNVGQTRTCSGYTFKCSTDADIDAPEAWDIERGNPNLKIAILDSGIPLDSLGKLSHEDLDDTNKFILGWECGDTSRTECVSAKSASINVGELKHGARVTGVAAAEANNNLGITGILWNCKVDIIKVTISSSDEIEGWKLSKAIRRAVDDTAKVINLSMAGYPWDDSTFGDKFMESAIAYAESNGVVLCAAVGNPAPTVDTIIGFPAAFASWGDSLHHPNGYRNVIAVGSTNWKDQWMNTRRSNSKYKVTVTAPGNGIFSTWAPPPFPSLYGCNQGTSFATPHLTGVVGLVRSKYPDSTASWVRQVIETTSDKVWQDPAKAAYDTLQIYNDWHTHYGFGRVNAYRAVTLKTLKAPLLDSAKVVRDPQDTTSWIKLYWRDISADENGFRIYRATIDSVYKFKLIYQINVSNATTFSNLRSNTVGSETYIYRVRTYENISKSGNFSDSAKVTNIPREPQNLTATVLIDSSCLLQESFGMIEPEAAPAPNCDRNLVKLTWQAPSPTVQKDGTIYQYTIHARSTDPNHHEKWLTVPGTVTEATICLKVDKTYDFWVHTIDTYGAQSVKSNKITRTTGHSGAIACVDDPPVTRAPIPDADPKDLSQRTPTEFSLIQNYPNPFNLSTQIRYSLPQDAKVQIVIYNILGQKIKVFELGYQTAGYKSVFWDGKDNSGYEVSSGIYFYRIVAGDFSQTKKMTLLK